MKNFLPLVIGAVIIAAAVFVVVRSNNKQASSNTPEKQTVETVSPTEAASNREPSASSQTLANGITLTVTTPSNNATVTSATVTVRGKTVPGAEVFVNDKDTKADANGNFSVLLTLDEGDNYILVVSNDDLGNYSEKELTVTYTP